MAPYVVQQYKYMKVLETRQIYLRMGEWENRGMGEWGMID